MIARELSLLMFMILPALTGTGHFGLSLVVGLGFFVLLLFAQGITLGLAPFFPSFFHRFLLVLTLGLGYTVFAGVLGVLNPQLKELLSYSLPMASFGALGILVHQPQVSDQVPSPFRWALRKAMVGFLVFVGLGFIREILSFGTLSLGFDRPLTRIFPNLESQVGLMSGPTGVFFLLGFFFMGRNYLQNRKETKEKDR